MYGHKVLLKKSISSFYTLCLLIYLHLHLFFSFLRSDEEPCCRNTGLQELEIRSDLLFFGHPPDCLLNLIPDLII